MDDYDLSEGYEGDADALSAFEGETLLMSFTGDWHFTVAQSESLAEACRTVDVPVAHHVVESDHGHDAFLVEPEKVGPPLRDFLADGLGGRTIHDTTTDDADAGEREEFAPVHNSLFGG
jgi:homoserine O-acetyltransferase